jgi:predicted O-linked N-acetylglucosamine transferase (SPINDLY family)
MNPSNPQDNAAQRRAWLAQEKIRHEQLCERNPGNFQAWWNLGRINLELGLPQGALAGFNQALSLNPDHLEVLIGKILACRQGNRLQEGLETAARAERIAPDNSDVLLHKGHLLRLLGNQQESLTVYERILALPDLTEQKRLSAVSAKVAILASLDRQEEALAVVAEGLATAPDEPTLLLNKAALLVQLQRYDEALACLDDLAQRPPFHFKALANKVLTLVSARRFAEADQVLDELRGRYPQRQLEREFDPFRVPEPMVAEDAAPKHITARGIQLSRFYFARLDCDWREYEDIVNELPALLQSDLERFGSIAGAEPFALLSLPLEPAFQAAVARARSQHIARHVAPLREKLRFAHPRLETGGRLRIGYVSGDFRDHATAHLARKLFQVHDRRRFEIFGYSLHPNDGSAYWQEISRACDHFVDLTRLSNADAARRIAQDGIHILLNLHGYTRFSRTEIFALRPAPVQVSFLGYPGTMGADFMDYIIADRVVLRPDEAEYYSEKPIYLPDCYQINDNTQPIAATGMTRAAQGLPENAFVYCCFNGSQKIDPASFTLWMRIVRQVPDSVLWLLGHSERMMSNLRRAAQGQGVDPHRLVFAQRLPKAEHLERHRLADLFLDTSVYNAHTTASDALWAGLPVLTLCGQTFPARVCTSLLFAVGLERLITYNINDFEVRAVESAREPAAFMELRQSLASSRLRCALFDTERFVAHLEHAFSMIWTVHATGGTVRVLEVKPSEAIDRVP